MHDARCKIQDVRCWSKIPFLSGGIGYWVLVTGYELGVAGYTFFRLLASDLYVLRLAPYALRLIHKFPNRSYPLKERGMAVGQEYLQGVGRQV